jgi:hypothetical protein
MSNKKSFYSDGQSIVELILVSGLIVLLSIGALASLSTSFTSQITTVKRAFKAPVTPVVTASSLVTSGNVSETVSTTPSGNTTLSGSLEYSMQDLMSQFGNSNANPTEVSGGFGNLAAENLRLTQLMLASIKK